MNDKSDVMWGHGWAFFKGDRDKRLLPRLEACNDWMKGFCTAMADYDVEENDASIEEALINFGISGELLESCLLAAELIFQSEDFQRMPNVQVRAC